MKSIKNIRLLLAGLLLLGFASCTDDNDDNANVEVGDAVQFTSAITGMQAKAAGDTWTAGDQVGIYMVKTGSTLVINEARNMKYTADAAGKLSAAGDDAIHYPASENTAVDFIAYHPYQSALDNYTYAINVKDQSQPEKIDLLYSSNAVGVTNAKSSVNLEFVHKLTKIAFNISAGDGLTDADLNNLKINIIGLNTVAECNLATSQINNVRTKEAITALTAANGKSSQVIVIPSADVIYDLEFELSNGITFESKGTAPVTFESGKIHTFNISVGASQVEISEGTITDWLGKDDDPILGGGTPVEPIEVVKYAVGDVYPKDGTAMGIVYEIWNEGKNGKVVSLVEKQDRWGNNSLDESTNGVTSIRNVDNGKEATKELIEKRMAGGNFATDYVIFNWVYNTMNGGDIDGVWYLPAKNELRALYATMIGMNYNDIASTWTDGGTIPGYVEGTALAAYNIFNKRVTDAGGTTFNFYGQYWAVTEISTQAAWAITFQTSLLRTDKSKGDNYGRARAIMQF